MSPQLPMSPSGILGSVGHRGLRTTHLIVSVVYASLVFVPYPVLASGSSRSSFCSQMAAHSGSSLMDGARL